MSEPITAAQLDRLFAAVPHEFHDHEIEGTGVIVPIRRVTIMEILGVSKHYHGLASALNRDSMSYAGLALEAGADAIATLISIGIGLKGRKEEAERFKQQLLNAPDELMMPLGYAIWNLTVGEGSVDDFFIRLRTMGAKAKILAPLPAAA